MVSSIRQVDPGKGVEGIGTESKRIVDISKLNSGDNGSQLCWACNTSLSRCVDGMERECKKRG